MALPEDLSEALPTDLDRIRRLVSVFPISPYQLSDRMVRMWESLLLIFRRSKIARYKRDTSGTRNHLKYLWGQGQRMGLLRAILG